jgi:hypothetical protein
MGAFLILFLMILGITYWIWRFVEKKHCSLKNELVQNILYKETRILEYVHVLEDQIDDMIFKSLPPQKISSPLKSNPVLRKVKTAHVSKCNGKKLGQECSNEKKAVLSDCHKKKGKCHK